MNFVCLVFELGVKTLTLSPMESLMVKCNLGLSTAGCVREIAIFSGVRRRQEF